MVQALSYNFSATQTDLTISSDLKAALKDGKITGQELASLSSEDVRVLINTKNSPLAADVAKNGIIADPKAFIGKLPSDGSCNSLQKALADGRISKKELLALSAKELSFLMTFAPTASPQLAAIAATMTAAEAKAFSHKIGAAEAYTVTELATRDPNSTDKGVQTDTKNLQANLKTLSTLQNDLNLGIGSNTGLSTADKKAVIAEWAKGASNSRTTDPDEVIKLWHQQLYGTPGAPRLWLETADKAHGSATRNAEADMLASLGSMRGAVEATVSTNDPFSAILKANEAAGKSTLLLYGLTKELVGANEGPKAFWEGQIQEASESGVQRTQSLIGLANKISDAYRDNHL
jgi:hypothetical protein